MVVVNLYYKSVCKDNALRVCIVRWMTEQYPWYVKSQRIQHIENLDSGLIKEELLMSKIRPPHITRCFAKYCSSIREWKSGMTKDER
jgi:hypothetical protein